MSNISNFKTIGQANFAFSNLYEVIFFSPEVLGPGGVLTNRGPLGRFGNASLLSKISLYCNGAQIPGVTIATTEKALDFRSRGKQKVFDDLTLTFYCSEDMSEYVFFNDWINEIVNPNNNRVGFHRFYNRNVYINKLGRSSSSFINRRFPNQPQNRKNEIVFQTVVEEVYPKRLDPIALAYGTSGNITTFSVNFAYTRHYHNTENLNEQ
jgi:hypothetical protein